MMVLDVQSSISFPGLLAVIIFPFVVLFNIKISLVEIHLENMHLPKYQHGGGAKCYVPKFGVHYSISYRHL